MFTEPREARPRTSTFQLRAGSLARIDLKTVDQDGSSPLYTKGVYVLEGNTLRYAVAAPGQPRPRQVRPVPGDGLTVVVLRHVKPQHPQRRY